jgi:adenylate cyclase
MATTTATNGSGPAAVKRSPRTSWRRRRALLLVAVGVVAAGLSIGAYVAHVLQGPELQMIDVHFSVRGVQPPPKNVAVVGIDATSSDVLRQRWPYPRRYEAKVIDRLRAAGARVIAMDIAYDQPTDNNDDQALANSIYSAGDVVLAADAVNPQGQPSTFGGPQVLREIHATWGISSVRADGDGVYRRTYYAVTGVRTFAVAAASRALGRPVPRSAFPTVGNAPIDFAGPPGTIPIYSFADVYAGHFPADAFRGRVVIVGATDPTLHDVWPTAASPGELMAGAELQANAISTILRGFPLKDAPGWLNIVLIVALGMVVPLANMRLRSWRVALLALLVAGGYVVATQIAFNNGVMITFTYPLLAILLATVGTLGADYLFTAFEHQRVRDTFSRFVDDAVVEDVLAHTGGDLRLHGEQVLCTVMFCDLRGFTSFSESLTATKVIEVVNFYLDQMTDAIMGAGGTLISYMGDGIMAVFGAPLTQPDHADRALRAAREMMGPRLTRFNEWMREEGFATDGFRMGIGLNTGTVMAGNVGSARRVEYTAIGDTTNTASRLEGMTKGSGHMLFIADSTRELLSEQPGDLVLIGDLAVRGRHRQLRVWSVPDPVEVALAPAIAAGPVPAPANGAATPAPADAPETSTPPPAPVP